MSAREIGICLAILLLAAGGNTNTDLFLSVVRDIAGDDAVSLVESWLYDAELPALSIPNSYANRSSRDPG
ncbi:MAG: hypothetical protein OXF99_08280 [bacterium]|nr:hypothetical protein [bacterium]